MKILPSYFINHEIRIPYILIAGNTSASQVAISTSSYLLSTLEVQRSSEAGEGIAYGKGIENYMDVSENGGFFPPNHPF